MGFNGKNIFRDRGGNFAILTSLAAVPLVLGAGMAIDLSTINARQSELQQAIDSAVLAVAREGKDISDNQARQIAKQFLAGNIEAKLTDIDVKRTGSKVEVVANTKARMAFGSLFGYADWPVSANATADLAFTAYEIALVLDTTGSMYGGKLASMKDAVLGLIDTMSAQITDDQKLKFAMVPFSTFVNVGPQYGPSFKKNGKVDRGTGAEWLDLYGKSDIPQLELKRGVSRFELMHSIGQEWKGCVETRMPSKYGEHDVADTEPTKTDRSSLFVPTFAIDEPDSSGYQNSYIASGVDPLDNSLLGQARKILKYGILTPLAVLETEPTVYTSVATSMSGSKGPGNGCVAQPITALTNDYRGLKSKVSALQAQGTTNIMEGVAWGMRVLSPGEPFTEGRENEPGVEKIMIVLTDGSNVFGNRNTKLGSSYSSFGYLVVGRIGVTAGGSSTTTGLMNQKTLDACDNAKAAGIEVYTIRLEEPDVATGSMLADCATSAAHYFDTPSRTDLDKVFSKIRENIVKLRISS